MEITGKFVKTLGIENGEKKDGTSWKKETKIFSLGGNYPKMIAVEFWNTNSGQGNKVDTLYELSVDVSSREVAGKWYTSVSCWKSREVIGVNQNTNQPQEQRQPKFNSAQEVKDNAIKNGNALIDDPSDLPFSFILPIASIGTVSAYVLTNLSLMA